MRIRYDNSPGNPRNPNHPPVLVTAGNRSQDEMGHVWLQVLPRASAETDPRWPLQEAAMTRRLQKYPADVLAHYNLAALLQSQGKLPEAAQSYAAAHAWNRTARLLTTAWEPCTCCRTVRCRHSRIEAGLDDSPDLLKRALQSCPILWRQSVTYRASEGEYEVFSWQQNRTIECSKSVASLYLGQNAMLRRRSSFAKLQKRTHPMRIFKRIWARPWQWPATCRRRSTLSKHPSSLNPKNVIALRNLERAKSHVARTTR